MQKSLCSIISGQKIASPSENSTAVQGFPQYPHNALMPGIASFSSPTGESKAFHHASLGRHSLFRACWTWHNKSQSNL